MEKDILISSLKEKSGVDNLSDRTFDEVADLWLSSFSDDSKITDETWKMPVQMLKTMSGQYRHDLSAGINDFKSRYEAEKKAAFDKEKNDAIAAAKAEWEKTIKPVETKPAVEETSVADAVKAAIADYNKVLFGEDGKSGTIGSQLNANAEFMKATLQRQKEETVNKIKGTLKDYLLDERMADREPVVNLAIRELEIDEKSDVDKLKIEVEKKYEKLYKEFYGDSHGGPWSGGGGVGDDSNKQFENFIKKREEKAKKEAADAEALKTLLK